MASPNYHNYTTVSGSTLEYTSTPVGNYNTAETWSGGAGVSIEINNFADHKLFEIGVTNISGSAAGDAEVYLFKKGQRI